MSLNASQVVSPAGSVAVESFPVVVTASRARPLVALVCWYAVIAGVGWTAGIERHPELAAVFMTVAALSAVALSMFVVKLAAGRPGTLSVSHNEVRLGKISIPRRGVDVAIRPWKQAPLWTVVGTAIELVGRDRTLTIGGREHLPPRTAVGAATRVDASLCAQEFVKLARALGAETSLVDGPANGVQIDLAPSGTGIVGAYRGMAPWFATMALAALIGVVGSALGFERSPLGAGVMLTLILAVLGGGLYVMFARSNRPPIVRYRLVVRHGSVHLSDVLARSATQLIELTPASVQRVTYRQVTRTGTYEYPALRLLWPGAPRGGIVVGVWDSHFLWSQKVKRSSRLDYLVGTEEWRVLLRSLNLDDY